MQGTCETRSKHVRTWRFQIEGVCEMLEACSAEIQIMMHLLTYSIERSIWPSPQPHKLRTPAGGHFSADAVAQEGKDGKRVEISQQVTNTA